MAVAQHGWLWPGALEFPTSFFSVRRVVQCVVGVSRALHQTCAVITQLLIFCAGWAVHVAVLPGDRTGGDTAHLALFDLLALLTSLNHWRAMTTDPVNC